MRVMWKLVLVHLKILLIFTQHRGVFCAERTLAQKSFLTHPMELLGDVGHVDSRFGSSEIVLVSVHDRSLVFTKRTIGSKIILDAPDGTPT
jgi:hypothetical protein